MLNLKINSTVFTQDDRTITKTFVTGIKKTADKTIYTVHTEKSGYSNNDEWPADKLYPTEAAARAALEAQIKEEIDERYQKIVLVDLTQERKK